ncbi:hypothetical protein BSKO_09452 [Bryopsis sp. KO-2023]|nr:hypothetical protein BSKO_09452 [Bryopsis sp. KO-2023]
MFAHSVAGHGTVARSIRNPHNGRRCLITHAVARTDRASKADDDVLSSVANAAINTPGIFNIMKFFAKRVLKNTAEKRGVPWTEKVQTYKSDEQMEELFRILEDPSIEYPSYYTREFHGYDEGNLNWDAAFEAEMASYVIAWRTFNDESIPAVEAFRKMKQGIVDALKDYRGDAVVKDILDAGCSVGCSTTFLANKFPEARVLGLDLSPYFLAVAEHSRRHSADPSVADRMEYRHALAEKTNLEDASFDVCSYQSVFHECPSSASTSILKESYRLLKPGGTSVIFDSDPTCEALARLPPVLFTLMKATEPWTDEYYAFDIEATMTDIGYEDVKTVCTDARHRVVLGRKPL